MRNKLIKLILLTDFYFRRLNYILEKENFFTLQDLKGRLIPSILLLDFESLQMKNVLKFKVNQL